MMRNYCILPPSSMSQPRQDRTGQQLRAVGMVANCFCLLLFFPPLQLRHVADECVSGFSVGDELGFKESLSNVENNRRRSVGRSAGLQVRRVQHGSTAALHTAAYHHKHFPSYFIPEYCIVAKRIRVYVDTPRGKLFPTIPIFRNSNTT